MSKTSLPGQDVLGGAAQQQSVSSASQDPSQPPADKPSYAKRGKITIVACVPCRRRKTKCDGKRPSCSQCDARAGQCSYDMTDDQRKLTYLRENVEHLQEKSNSLESLLGTIQAASEEEAIELFRRLRSGVDVHMIADLVQAGHLLSGVSRKRRSQELGVSSLTQPSLTSPERTRLQNYDRLLNSIIESGPSSSLDIMRRIRRQEPLDSILHDVSTGRLGSQPLFSSSTGQTLTSIEKNFERQDQRFGMLKGEDVSATHAAAHVRSEFPVSTAPRRSWTSVTQNNDLIEHLVTLYFTWQHCFFQSFPEKLFRADMRAGRTKFCSSMLVNAICSAGCFFSNRKEVTEDSGDGFDLKVLFYDEAVSLLGQNPRPSVPTTATLYLLSYVEGTRGDLSSLWSFSGRSSLMALDLNLHLHRDTKTTDDEKENEVLQNEELARSHAFWGCFHVDQTTCFTLGRLPMLNRNGITMDLPEANDEEDEATWEAYETDLPHRAGARSSTFRYCATLANVVNSTLMMFFAPVVPLSGSLLLDEYEKYLNWYQSLPSILSETENAPPHVLCLHMYYHSAVLLLFRPFLKATLHNSDVVPREVCRSAANSISNIWEQHYTTYGLAGIYMFQVHCLLTACTIHIINIPTIASTNHFTRACKLFQELLPRNEWARSSLHILRNLVEKWSLILPIEAEDALYFDDRAYREQVSTKAMNQPASQPSHGMMSWRRTTQTGSMQNDPQMPNVSPMSPGRRPESPTSPTTVTKRTSSEATRTLLRDSSGSSSQDPDTSQKRQRLRSPTQLRKIGVSGSESPGAPLQPQPVANYLYAPLSDQQAPILVPVHSQGGSSQTAAAEEEIEDRDMEPEITAAQQNRSGRDPSDRPRRSGRGKKSNAGIHGIEDGVEGLSFGDDWRDPFMGYLGET